MTPDHDEALDMLAADYVLGTLRGEACVRFEERMRSDPEAARRVREWEARLSPLADDYASAQVPDGMWESIERRLFRAEGPVARATAYWRRFALGAASLALLFLVSSVWLAAGDGRPQCYAVLVDAQNRPALVVFDRRQMQELVALPVGTRLGTREGSAQLWIVTRDSATPVGLLEADGETRLILNKPMATAVMAADVRLVVTREPAGGSTSGRPSTARIAEGAVALL